MDFAQMLDDALLELCPHDVPYLKHCEECDRETREMVLDRKRGEG